MPDPTPTDLTEAAHYAYNEAIRAASPALHVDACTEDDHAACDGGDWEREAKTAIDAALPALRRMILAEVDHTIATMPPIRLGDTFRGSIDRALVKVRETIAGVRDA